MIVVLASCVLHLLRVLREAQRYIHPLGSHRTHHAPFPLGMPATTVELGPVVLGLVAPSPLSCDYAVAVTRPSKINALHLKFSALANIY